MPVSSVLPLSLPLPDGLDPLLNGTVLEALAITANTNLDAYRLLNPSDNGCTALKTTYRQELYVAYLFHTNPSLMNFTQHNHDK